MFDAHQLCIALLNFGSLRSRRFMQICN